jgi:hypothetical protein
MNFHFVVSTGGRGAPGRGRGMVRDAKGPDWDCSGDYQSKMRVIAAAILSFSCVMKSVQG